MNGSWNSGLNALEERMNEKLNALEGRLMKLSLDQDVRLDGRLLAFEERMDKRFAAFEDRMLHALAGYAEGTDRRFARIERVIADQGGRSTTSDSRLRNRSANAQYVFDPHARPGCFHGSQQRCQHLFPRDQP